MSYVDPYGLDFLDSAANFCAGWGDTLSFGLTSWIRDELDIGSVDKSSSAYTGGQVVGFVNGGLPAAVRGTAALGGTRTFHTLNHNRYLRVGPGRMPSNGGLPSGTGVPRMSVGHQGLHLDLRSRLPHMVPTTIGTSDDSSNNSSTQQGGSGNGCGCNGSN